MKNSTDLTKIYLLIFIYLNIRSLHIEIIPDMTTQSFINALIRFCNFYGFPSRIYSDNARSFSSALRGNIIKNHVNTDKFSNEFQINNIKHVKVPLYSPWVGSIWERMIRTIKNCLYKTISKQKIDYFQLLTVLSDIQYKWQ